MKESKLFIWYNNINTRKGVVEMREKRVVEMREKVMYSNKGVEV